MNTVDHRNISVTQQIVDVNNQQIENPTPNQSNVKQIHNIDNQEMNIRTNRKQIHTVGIKKMHTKAHPASLYIFFLSQLSQYDE